MLSQHLRVSNTYLRLHLIRPDIIRIKLTLFRGLHVLVTSIIPGIKLLGVIIPVSQSQPGTYPPLRRGEILRHEIITQQEILPLVPAILACVP